MFTEALRELRHHPGRMVATLVAIAVSVGFLVGISMFVRTQGVALGKEQAVATSKADVVVDTDGAVVDPDEVTRTIKETQGVGAVDTVLSTSMPAAHGHDSVMIDLHQVPEEPFRWSTVKDGSWPSKADEVALSEDAAKQLQVSIGDTVAFSGHDLKVVGITDDPSALQTAPAYVGQLPGQAPNTWVIKAKDGTAPGQLVTNLEKTLSKVKDAPQFNKDDAGATISTADSFQKKTINSLTEDFDVTKYMLMVFGAIALLVGAIIITTTFLILLAQRRRQIGLMRAVGASSGQVRRRVLAEAIVLGVLGSVLGVVLGILLTVAGTAYTGALAFGLAWPWGDIIVEFLIGIVITVLAAFLPALQATRVAPLEALRPVPTVEQKRRIGIARIVVCSLLAVAGIALSVGAIVGTGTSIIVMAILSAMCLSLTCLLYTSPSPRDS